MRLEILHVQDMGFLNDLLKGIKIAHKEKFGGVDAHLSKAAEFTPAGLGRFLAKKEHPKLEPLGRLADVCGLRIASIEEAHTPEYAFISIGDGKPERGLAFRRSWLATRTSTAPEDLRVLPMEGDGMHPTLGPGDMLLVDQGEGAKTLILDKIYVVRMAGHTYVKRFRRAPDRLLFMGDNRERAYEDLEIRSGEEADFAVLGRVLWAGKEL